MPDKGNRERLREFNRKGCSGWEMRGPRISKIQEDGMEASISATTLKDKHSSAKQNNKKGATGQESSMSKGTRQNVQDIYGEGEEVACV